MSVSNAAKKGPKLIIVVAPIHASFGGPDLWFVTENVCKNLYYYLGKCMVNNIVTTIYKPLFCKVFDFFFLFNHFISSVIF